MILVLLATVLFSHAQPIEDFSSDPRWVKISPKDFTKRVSENLGGGIYANCPPYDFQAYLAQERKIEAKRAEFGKKLKHFRKKSPEIDDLDKLLKTYPELAASLEAIRVEQTKSEAIKDPSGKCNREAKDAELAKIHAELSIFEEPSLNAKKIGTLQFSASRPNRVEVAFRDLSGKSENLPIDVDRDFGAYYTALAQKGDWIKIPRKPFPKPVWVQLNNGEKARPIKDIDFSLIIETPTFEGQVILEKIENGFYLGRVANDGDDPCQSESEDFIDLPEFQKIPLKIPVKEFFDKDQHVNVRRGYRKC